MPIITTLEMMRSFSSNFAAQRVLDKPQLGQNFGGAEVAAETLDGRWSKSGTPPRSLPEKTRTAWRDRPRG